MMSKQITHAATVIVGVVLIASIFLQAHRPVSGEDTPAADERIYELRTYTTHPGKLPDLLTRFNDHTVGLFARHGMVSVGYWVPVDTGNTLVYILSHQSREAAERSWKAFLADPDWQQAFQASRAEGPIVSHVESVFMKATSFSQIR